VCRTQQVVIKVRINKLVMMNSIGKQELTGYEPARTTKFGRKVYANVAYVEGDDRGKRFAKLSRSNWQEWVMLMEAYLREKELWYVIASRDPSAKEALRSSITEDDRSSWDAQWEKDDEKVYNKLVHHIEVSQLMYITEEMTGRSGARAWEQLREKNMSTNGMETMLVLRDIHTMKFVDGDMDAFILKMYTQFNRLALMGAAATDESKVTALLMALDDRFSTFSQMVMILPSNERTFARVIKRLEEVWRQLEVQLEPSHGQARAVHFKARPNFRKPVDNGAAVRVKRCFQCDSPTHLRAACPQVESSSSFPSLSQRFAELTVKPPLKKSNFGGYSANMAYCSNTSNNWVTDSGASEHLYCGQSSNLLNRQIVEEIVITVADGRTVSSTEVGELHFRINGKEHKLERVYLVPALDKNLLSVGQLTKSGYSVTFTDDVCTVHDTMNDLAFNAIKTNGIYLINIIPLVNHVKAYLMDSKVIASSGMTWGELHRITGHTSVKTLINATNQGFYFGIKIDEKSPVDQCETCMIMKMTKKQVPNIISIRESSPYQVLRLDLFGPIPCSRLGDRYAMTVLEDYFDETIVIPLRKKSDALHKIQELVK
jgi:hypothetical protein